ncbi:toll/interleukin-1 receptor domain-containing protein [Novipirellula rosea]|uniref:TIR domain-containing protein n=1 Tax=Novipirellula rosea TaxID=1031540 RepID=A0ABP8NHD8_9BACT
MELAISLAYRPANKSEAEAIRDEIIRAHPDVTIDHVVVDDTAGVPANGALHVVLFDEQFDDDPDAVAWLTKVDAVRATTPLFPIALNPDHGRPPKPIANLKSRNWLGDRDEVLVSIAAAVGLSLRPGENNVFVSYRQVDGSRSANLIEQALRDRGFSTWRDESNSLYDAPNLRLGEDVQEEIEKNIATASALILVDTPRSAESSWVRLEVELAVGKMIPIFPVVLHSDSVQTHVSRFRILESLHRRAVLQSEYVDSELLAPKAELNGVVSQFEVYLQRVYQNRIVQLRDLEKFLASKGCEFARNSHLPHLHNGRLQQATKMMSLLACCSFEDQIFAPRVRGFVDGMTKLAALKQMFSCNFYLYPGQTLIEDDLLEIIEREVPELRDVAAELLSYNDAVARVSLLTEGYGV